MADYGWCAYCRQFTYHDLVHGACGDCLWRWRTYPATLPAEWRMKGWQPTGERQS